MEKPKPVIGPNHGPSITDQLRLIRQLAGMTSRRGVEDLQNAVAYVDGVTADMLAALSEIVAATQSSVPDAAAADRASAIAHAAIAKAEGRANG